MDLSIIIVSWNVRDLLKQCLDSIFRETRKTSFEIFVVDNSSADGTQEMLQTYTKPHERESENTRTDLRIILNKENLGFSKANNLALKQAKSEFVLFLNPDTELCSISALNEARLARAPAKRVEELHEGALDKLVSLMRARPDVSALTCKLLNSDGSIQRLVRRHPTFWSQILIVFKLHHLSPWCQTMEHYLAKDFDYSKESQVEQIMGACFLARMNLMKELGGWDESYWLWWEDVQLCTDFYKHGWKIIYTPEAKILHHEGKSFVQWSHWQRQKQFNKSMTTYFKKNGAWWQALILKILNPLSLSLALVAQLLNTEPKPQTKL